MTDPAARPVGTARRELLDLLHEALYDMRRNFGMFGQIHISFEDVTPERLTVRIRTVHPLDGHALASNVRNAVLNRLQDLLPGERFVAVYDNPEQGVAGEPHELPFVVDTPTAGKLPSSEVLFEQNMGPAREALRPRFREAWRRLVEEAAG